MVRPNPRSDGLLLLTAAIWGFAFVAQRIGMEHVGPFAFNGVRFALGSLSLVPLMRLRGDPRNLVGCRSPRSGAKQVLTGGAIAGSVLFLGASLQQVGIVHTTAGKAGFITGLYVVFVPLLGLLWRQWPRRGAWLGAVSAAAGLFLLSVRESLTVSLGDSLVLASAVFWAAHVLLIGWMSPRIDPIRLACVQFATCSVLSLTVAVLAETVTAAGLRAAALPILYGGLLSVGVAYTLQVVAQRTAQSTHAAVLLSLEAVFAALGGWIVLGETLPARAILGCVLMLAGALVSQASATERQRAPATTRAL